MHQFSIPEGLTARVVARVGRAHPFDKMDASKTAFIVVDMQNYFMKAGYPGEVPMARAIVPRVNQLAAELRKRGAHVVWIKNATDARENWSVFHDWLMSREFCDRRYAAMNAEQGNQLWPELDVKPEDAQIEKRRFSAFIQGASDVVPYLHGRGIDTLLIGGTATNICCESSARDATMLNFKVIMVPDVLATWTDAEHNATLATFYAMFGDVQTSDEVLASLSRGQEATAA